MGLVLWGFLLIVTPACADVEELLRGSVLSLSVGDVAGARAKARQGLRAAPGDGRVLEQLARAELAALDFPAAEAAAERALKLGVNPARLVQRARARAGRGDFEGSLADAESAVRLSPGSGPARLTLAAAKEGLGRAPQDIIADYRRAAELDVALAETAARAAARLQSVPAQKGGARLGPILATIAISALFGWVWSKLSKPDGAAVSPAAQPLLANMRRLSPREALAAAREAAERASPDSRALAEALYECLTGRPPFPHEADRALGRYRAASLIDAALPEGIDAFFARALDPDPARRFHDAGELIGALRSVIDPPVL